jgi:hypothetical protein
MSMALALVIVASTTFSCGTEPAEEAAPQVQLRFRQLDETEYRPLAENEAQPLPATLILTLVGPDGARTVTIDFAERKVALGELREGRWSLRGDGLDDSGNLRWQAPPVSFVVRPGKSTQVQLDFQQLPAAPDSVTE